MSFIGGLISGARKRKFGQSSLEESAAPEIADPTMRLGTCSAAHQMVDLYSTEGPIGMKVVADPTDAVLGYVPKSSHCDDNLLTSASNSIVFVCETT